MTTIRARIQPYQKTAAALASENDVPLQGERVRATDTGRMKTGDGTTHYNDLDYDDDIAKVTGLLIDHTGDAVTGRRLQIVLDENGEIDDILTEEA